METRWYCHGVQIAVGPVRGPGARIRVHVHLIPLYQGVYIYGKQLVLSRRLSSFRASPQSGYTFSVVHIHLIPLYQGVYINGDQVVLSRRLSSCRASPRSRCPYTRTRTPRPPVPRSIHNMESRWFCRGGYTKNFTLRHLDGTIVKTQKSTKCEITSFKSSRALWPIM